MSGAGLGLPPREVPPWPSFDVERTSVRTVLLDADGRLLLFDTLDPHMPATGRWWELPGGGMERGEDIVATAVREVAEETGLVVAPEAVGRPRWRRHATYVRRYVRTLQHEHVVTVRLTAAAPALSSAGRTPSELEEYVGHRWWTPAEVQASQERFFPGSLPRLLGPFLRGEQLDEPFELWN